MFGFFSRLYRSVLFKFRESSWKEQLRLQPDNIETTGQHRSIASAGGRSRTMLYCVRRRNSSPVSYCRREKVAVLRRKFKMHSSYQDRLQHSTPTLVYGLQRLHHTYHLRTSMTNHGQFALQYRPSSYLSRSRNRSTRETIRFFSHWAWQQISRTRLYAWITSVRSNGSRRREVVFAARVRTTESLKRRGWSRERDARTTRRLCLGWPV